MAIATVDIFRFAYMFTVHSGALCYQTQVCSSKWIQQFFFGGDEYNKNLGDIERKNGPCQICPQPPGSLVKNI